MLGTQSTEASDFVLNGRLPQVCTYFEVAIFVFETKMTTIHDEGNSGMSLHMGCIEYNVAWAEEAVLWSFNNSTLLRPNIEDVKTQVCSINLSNTTCELEEEPVLVVWDFFRSEES